MQTYAVDLETSGYGVVSISEAGAVSVETTNKPGKIMFAVKVAINHSSDDRFEAGESVL